MGSINYFLDLFASPISELLHTNCEGILESINEIRIRKNKPLIIYVGSNCLFLNNDGSLTSNPSNESYIVSTENFEYTLDNICNNSFHTNVETMINGYVTTKNGSRVGICGKAVYKQGVVSSIKEISSLNIRIAKEYRNTSRVILNEIYKNVLPNIIVASLPGMGKTTFLRDYTRLISSGYNGKYQKAVVVDERCEIAGQFDVGYNTDVLSGFAKEKGIEMAVRTMSPDVIVCDEISTVIELNKIKFGFNTGVKFAVSVHLDDLDNLNSNSVVGKLIELNRFDYLILLKRYTEEYEIYDLRNEEFENSWNYNDNYIYNIFRNCD